MKVKNFLKKLNTSANNKTARVDITGKVNKEGNMYFPLSERRKSYEELFRSKSNLQTVFDTTDTIYVLIDNDLRIISYNPRAVDFARNELGHNIEISQYFLDYFPAEKQSLLRVHIAEVQKGEKVNYEKNYPQPDGSCNCYDVRMFPITSDGGKICGIVMAVSDITEKKRLEREILEQKVQEQKKIAKAIADAQEKERTEMGRELHDNILQILTTSILFASHSLYHPEQYREYIQKTKEHLVMAVEALRNLSHALVGPCRDASLGLIDSLGELICNVSLVKNIPVIFKHSTFREEEYEAGLKLVIYRIIQEQMNNILKHSAATEIQIELRKSSNVLTVIISDNGKGFDPTEKKNGIGLKNIVNRAQLYNGVILISSSPGKGCKLTAVFS